MDTKLSVVKDNTGSILLAVRELQRNDVMVGVPAEKAPRNAEEAKSRGVKINNAALAYIHNYGMPSLNIPARPFLEPGIKNAEKPITSHMRAAGERAFEGKIGEMNREMHRVGIVAVTGIKTKIQTGPFVPLAASTLAARRRRGRTGTRPLIDTAQMLGAQSYVIRRKAKS